MTEKRILDTRSTMKNYTSYVLNTVLTRGCEGLARVEVWQKPVSAKSVKRTALTYFCQTSTLANLSDHNLKRCWVHNSPNSSSLSEHRKFVFLSFSLGMFLIVPITGREIYFAFSARKYHDQLACTSVLCNTYRKEVFYRNHSSHARFGHTRG